MTFNLMDYYMANGPTNFRCEASMSCGPCDRLFGHKGEHRCAGDHENEGEGPSLNPSTEGGSSPSPSERPV